MTTLILDDIKTLVEKHQPPCISIYVPALKGATEANQNFVRFKNLFRRAEDELIALGIRKTQADKLLEPIRPLLQDSIYWHQPCSGFAMFLAPEFFKTFAIERGVPEIVTVGERFYTKPLMSLPFENGRFYVLAVSQKGVRFFNGNRYGMYQIQLANLPRGIDELLMQYVGERHVEFHTGAGRQTGARQAYPAFHGQGGGSLNSDDKILGYLYEVDKCLHRHLQKEHAPLVFAGVEYLFPMYKQANTYQNLVDHPITGNPDRLSANQLHQEAMTIVTPLLDEKKRQLLDKYRQFAGTGHTASDAKEIVLKALTGRVDTLFLAHGAHLWGHFDSASQTVELHESKRPESEDLLDLAANETFMSSGTVYEFEAGYLPENLPAAAILRW